MGKLLETSLKRFFRNPNATRDFTNAVTQNKSCLANTISVLKDPENNRELVLIGTMNASNLLAKRTENLLKDFNPDSLLVQTNPNWYDYLNKNVDNIETN